MSDDNIQICDRKPLLCDMSRRIGRVVYNTRTAKLIWRVQKGVRNSFVHEFNAFEAALYRHPSGGGIFLAGIGGALTPLGRDHQDGRIWGQQIFLLNSATSERWAAQRAILPSEVLAELTELRRAASESRRLAARIRLHEGREPELEDFERAEPWGGA
ncbi:hypothetical protein [Pseudogemmobacter humi]|uniref:Uncharacterized protein n=1 Tax=Pseudogemmobacter humi TaxID=2483812 RepID=A0A3P5XJ73_9RHOB|nr:hypothetical protein [Pseudogemmobacter humi]VDC28630.1 hypothetical protein XINFAN_02195 [Pseudogemmobacter humi]